MPDTIVACLEEEYAPCLAYPRRRRDGWTPVFVPFRGPAGVSVVIGLALTLIGWWRFARRPRRLADVDAAVVRGGTVTEVSAQLGSYGMGGPGFVGLRVAHPNGSGLWMVYTLWGAAGWLTVGDDLLADDYSQDARQKLAGARRFRPLSDFIGSTLTDIRLTPDLAELTFSGAAGPLVLRLRRDSTALPAHAGSGEPKVLAPSQDVRDAVIVSRYADLWVGEA